jgi:hypothetical protein
MNRRDLINLAINGESAKFVDIVKDMLMTRTASALDTIRTDLAQNIMPQPQTEQYSVDDMVRVTNPKATPRYKITGVSDTHYDLEKDGKKLSLPKDRIHKVMDRAKNQYTQISVENEEHDEVEDLTEAMKLVKTHEGNGKTAKVYRDTDWDEFRVKHYTDGKYHDKADYHTDDVNDAHDTAQAWLKKE